MRSSIALCLLKLTSAGLHTVYLGLSQDGVVKDVETSDCGYKYHTGDDNVLTLDNEIVDTSRIDLTGSGTLNLEWILW
jgi:hypothetical protein